MQNLILECAIRALLIAICAGAVLYALRVKAARVRHAVWASVVIWMLALPVWTAWGPRAVVRVLSPVASPAANRTTISTDTFSPQAASPTVRISAWTWQNCLAGIYLLGFLTLLTRLAIGTVRAHMLIRRDRAGRGPAPLAPVTVGWLKPIVILPANWRQWPQAQLHAVLAHEEEHARWRDPLVQWLALLNRAIFWFHPLAWWLERRLSALSEEACDAAVLARGHDRFEYSEYLLEMARALRQSARVNVMGMAMPGAFLPQRIRRILEGRPAQRLSRVRIAFVAVACAVVSTVVAAGAMDHAQVVASSQPQKRFLTVAAPFAAEPSPQRPKVLLAQAASPTTPQGSGSISGIVEDPSGSRVPNCLIVLHSQSGASDLTVRSNAAGLYQFPSIPPGHYDVEYQMPGFAILKKETVTEAGTPVRIDAMLIIGHSSEVVTVVRSKPMAPPPPSAALPALEPGRISVGGRVENAHLLVHPEPVYPPELLQQGVEATVHLAAVISSDGAPQSLHALNPDEVDARFVQAALDAVSQWRYQPTKLNEHPVANVTKIDVVFQLQ